MTKTFTLFQEYNTQKSEKKAQNCLKTEAIPSDLVLNTILNFSKNLEVKPSKILGNLEYLRS